MKNTTFYFARIGRKSFISSGFLKLPEAPKTVTNLMKKMLKTLAFRKEKKAKAPQPSKSS